MVDRVPSVRTAVARPVSAAGFAGSTAAAHSVSDAYLTLDAGGAANGESVVHGQWDIALRDLDLAIGLDANGDGKVTPEEMRAKRPAPAQ